MARRQDIIDFKDMGWDMPWKKIQKQIANIVSELMPQLCALSDEIFDYAEPGYEEYRSSLR